MRQSYLVLEGCFQPREGVPFDRLPSDFRQIDSRDRTLSSITSMLVYFLQDLVEWLDYRRKRRNAVSNPLHSADELLQLHTIGWRFHLFDDVD